MGLFSTIGKLAGFVPGVGPIGAAVASGVGGLIDGKREDNSRASYNAQASAESEAQSKRLMNHQFNLNRRAAVPQVGKIIRQAQKNGINPLTMLGVGATGTSAGVSSAPIMASPEFVGAAMDRTANSWFSDNNGFQPVDTELDELKKDMMREEIKDLERRNSLPLSGFGYNIQTTTSETRSDPILEPGRHTATNPFHRNSGTYVDPRSVDAEAAEARSGEVGEQIAGVANTVRDFTYDRKMQKIVKKHGRAVADKVNEAYATDPSLKTLDDAVRKIVPPKLGTPGPQTTKGRGGSAMTSN